VIKELGINGGGYFNVNFVYLFENFNVFINLFEIFLLLLILFVLICIYGFFVGDCC